MQKKIKQITLKRDERDRLTRVKIYKKETKKGIRKDTQMFSKRTYKWQIVLGLRTWKKSLIKYQSFFCSFCSLLFACSH